MHTEFTTKYVCFGFFFPSKSAIGRTIRKNTFKITYQLSKDFSPVLTAIFTVAEGKWLTVNTVGLSGSKVQLMPNARGEKRAKGTKSRLYLHCKPLYSTDIPKLALNKLLKYRKPCRHCRIQDILICMLF